MKNLALIAWFPLCAAILGCSFAIELEHNVLTWHPSGFTNATLIAIVIYVLALTAAIGLARRTHAKAGRTVMWALLLLLAIVGAAGLREEWAGNPKPRTPSPFWYRSTHAAALALPAVAVWIARRRLLAT